MYRAIGVCYDYEIRGKVGGRATPRRTRPLAAVRCRASRPGSDDVDDNDDGMLGRLGRFRPTGESKGGGRPDRTTFDSLRSGSVRGPYDPHSYPRRSA